jgi:MFS family permease
MTESRDDPGYAVPVVVGSLITSVFFGGVGGGVAFPTLPTLGSLLGMTPFVVGLVLSANRFTRLVMNTPAGQIIDKRGTRSPMILGLVVQGVAPFGYALGLYADRIPMLGATEIFLGARMLWGVGSAFVFVGAYSTVIHVTTRHNRGKWIGYFRGGQSLGFPTGLILGGILTDFFGYAFAFVTAGVTGTLAAVVAIAVLPDVSPTVHEPARLRALPGIVRSDPRILMIGSVNFTIRLLFSGILLVTIVLYAQNNGVRIGTLSAIGVSGVLMAVSVVASGATTVVAGNFSDRLQNRALVAVPALGAFAAGFGTLAFVPTLAGIVVAIVLIGIGSGGTSPPLMALLGDISREDDVGKMGGIYNVFGDVGATIGPIVALPVADRFGYRTEYVLCVGLVVLVGLVFVRPLLRIPTDGTPSQ